ncbi:MAG: HDOD domain-containing protein [Candidatus Fibromonas sp.]|nr:HDOD domain-containing protein [Candidatus Fibromonas sp.]
MNEEICVARQPILNRDKELFGYELLFRRSGQANANSAGTILSDMNATAVVLDNVLNNIGIDKIVQNSPAFLNCSYDFLLSEIPLSLNPDIFVLEILESVKIDEKIIEAVKTLHEKGFKMAIDDFIPTKEKLAEVAPIVPYLAFCKLEYPQIKEIKLLHNITKSFQQKNVKVLAEKIETEEDFKISYDAGADLFQGYFFTKPETIKSVKINSDAMGILKILSLMNKDGLDMMDLENEFKNHPDLTVNLLKYLNSAAFAMRSKIQSIRHALSLLGLSNLRQWLLILAYAGPNSSAERSPLLMNATMRANFFGELAKKLNWPLERVEKVYLMGLISHLDALYQTSLTDVLEQISLDNEITTALLEKKGTMGLLVSLINFIEHGDVKDMDQILENLTLSSQDISDCLNSAYKNSII